jgi:hypothetical protein
LILVRAITYFAGLITITCVVSPTSAFSQDAPAEPPTSLEQTLADHVCDRLPTPPATANRDPVSAQDAHEQCARVQLGALRAEFGYDLGHLSAAERARMDSTCSRLRKPENYEPYLNCLTALLVSVRELRRGADGIAPGAATDVSFGVPVLPADFGAAPRPKHHWVAIVITLVVIVAAAAAGFIVMRMKKLAAVAAASARKCQKCGEALQSTGDLCATCRHEAGVAAKQAIADRAAEERAELERRRLEREQAAERQRQLEQQAAEQQRLEEARLQFERERQQAAAQMPPPAPVPVPGPVPIPDPGPVPVPAVAMIGADVEDTPAELDPYTVLGVPRGASRQQIETAYCSAASKYDETLVAHLGDAVQQHYRAKAEAIEHAYRALIAG